MPESSRGRHRSTDKAGKKTLTRLGNIAGVEAVVIGRSVGGKSLGRSRGVGDFKLQGEVPGGFKGVLQTSKGIQEIFVRVSKDKDKVAAAIRREFI
jgi:hypothetical protein